MTNIFLDFEEYENLLKQQIIQLNKKIEQLQTTNQSLMNELTKAKTELQGLLKDVIK